MKTESVNKRLEDLHDLIGDISDEAFAASWDPRAKKGVITMYMMIRKLT